MKQKLLVLRKTILAFFMTLFSIWGLGQTITINLTSAGGSSNLGNGNYSSGAERTWTQDNISFGGKAITAATSPNTGAIQAQANNGVIYNTIAVPGRIKTIQVNQNSSTAFTLYGGTSRLVNSTSANYTVTGGVSEGSVTGTTWTSADLSSKNYTFFALKKGGSAAYITSIVITYEATSTPSFSVTGTFSPFSYVAGNGPSASQSVQVSGSNLDGSDVTVTAPANYEVSLTNGNDFEDSKVITYSNNTITNQNVYARLKSGLAVNNNYSGNVTVSGGGATSVDTAVQGSVIVTPTVTPSSQTGTVGTAFSYQIQATENPISYAIANGNTLPDGLSLDTTSGIISGAPTTAGGFTTNVTATNNAGTSSPAAIDFTIAKGTQVITGFTDTTKYLSSPAFTFAANTDIADLPVTYASSNTGVATVSGNTITIVGVGTTNITATQAGDSNWNALNQQIVLTVSPDPVTYNGVGRFEKISSVSDLTDGYYVITNETDQFLMTNGRSGSATTGYFVSANSNATSGIILDPSQNNVWLIKTDGTNTKTIYNEVISKYVGWSSGNSASIEDSPANTNRWTFTYANGKFTVNNLAAPAEQLSYNSGSPRFAAYANAGQQELQLYKLVETTTWDGTAWSNGDPDNKDVIITGPYSTGTQPSFDAQNITIKNGGVLEISSTGVINGVDVTVENGGNLIQRDGSVLNYTGAFQVLKNGASAVNKYAFWSSPVVNQDLLTIYGAGNTPAYVTQYNTATDYFVNATSTIAITGVGYSIKTPVANAALTFAGVPNTGSYTTTLSTAGNGFNLIGNPYPSNLDLNAFYNANSARISNTFYFWDNTSNSVTTQGGATTTNVGYATYNPASQVWVPAPNVTTVPAGNTANVGQGFLVKATNAADTSLSFTNDMRVGVDGANFNKTTTLDEGKFWLRLNSSYNTSNTFAVAYISLASNAYDIYDSRAMATGSDAFYTLADSQKLVIQGRAGFDANDVVPVGAKHFENGSFIISLVQKEGIFNNGQAIYLHDKVLGTYTNLQNGNYTFTANAGELTTRFEIVYKDLNVLATTEVKNDVFEVYKDGEEFVVRNNKNINRVELFDASGRKIQQFDANAKEVRLKLDTRGLYILKATSGNKEYTKKLIK